MLPPDGTSKGLTQIETCSDFHLKQGSSDESTTTAIVESKLKPASFEKVLTGAFVGVAVDSSTDPSYPIRTE